MTDGITEAMRDTVEAPPDKRRVWRIAVDGDEVQRRIEVVAVDASSAVQAAFIRGVLEGATVEHVSVQEVIWPPR